MNKIVVAMDGGGYEQCTLHENSHRWHA
jgi:hypothetical protein